jgi:hypothetical protein
MLSTGQLSRLADYMIENVETSEEYKDESAFSFTWEGHRLYVEKRLDHYVIEAGLILEKLEMPRL